MASKMIELFLKNMCVGDIELLYRLSSLYNRVTNNFVKLKVRQLQLFKFK